MWTALARLRAGAALLVALGMLAASAGTLAAAPAQSKAAAGKLADDDVEDDGADAPPEFTGQLDLPADMALPGAAAAPNLPGNEPLFNPAQPAIQDQQPDWVGPGCEQESGGGFWRKLLPPSNGRYRPIGNPLLHESWLNRPFYFGLVTGGVFNTSPIQNHVDGTPGYWYGFRLGWDVEYFWGVETRIGYSVSGVLLPGVVGTLSNMRSLYWDTDFLWYPWGDTQWRPFFLLGLGLVDYKFVADTGYQVHQTAFEAPFGVGLKYRHNNHWIFRLDVTDNFTFASGGGLSAMNNISILGSLEAHFAIGPKRSYWPWNPARAYH